MYRKTGPARVFTSERAAIAAIKGQTDRRLQPGDILVLMGRGPLGSGMEETYQITSALKYVPWGRDVAVLTDARFSGVSTGACIGHVGPEALAGGPIGKVRDDDQIRIVIDRHQLDRQRGPGGRCPAHVASGRSRARVGRSGRRTPTCSPTRNCPPKPGSGPRCSSWAAARGAGASTT